MTPPEIIRRPEVGFPSMSILKVARIGHPAVRARAVDVTPDRIAAPDFQRLVDDMIETMHEYDGVGLAAPQVHVGLRLAVIEVSEEDDRTDAAVPLMVLVNPVVRPIGDEKLFAKDVFNCCWHGRW